MKNIAVVGMACRFPGGIDNLDLLVEGLRQRKVTATRIPPDRWDADRYYAADKNIKGKAYVTQANFLTQDVRAMDGDFFDMPPRMAETVDPQQRLLLELIWEAFENAGLDLPAHAGKNVGVYIGGFMLDHMIGSMQKSNRTGNNAGTAAGMMMTMLSNRLSYMFDLHGPSLSLDTACSSSLVAFNYACRDIWSGVCDMAIVGGVNVIMRPEYVVGMCKGQFLAMDGQCKSFDARGDGYGRGEGAGIVVLKALDKAMADGDPILATVAGAGVNSDGRTPGISMPSAEAQTHLIREVCEHYQIDPSEVRYVECHGTGTAVGDPIEARSVGTVYGAGRGADDRVVLGSIKSNIGHLEAAAGVASVIKAVLTLTHREVFPLGNLETPNPAIAFEELGVRLADASGVLPHPDKPALVAINSFGYGGTNAHVVLRSAPAPAEVRSKKKVERANGFPLYLPLSTRNPAALCTLAQRYSDLLARPDVNLADVLYSAAHRRAPLNHRAVVIGDDAAGLREGLDALVRGEKSERVVTGQQSATGLSQPVWVFTGMGPQWWAMGQELYRDDPIYRKAVQEADQIFKRISGFSILAEMLKDEAGSPIMRTEYAQPANFMVQWGLAAMLKAGGVTPGAVVGHSVGEVVAACVSGALSLEDALRVSYHRSRLQALTAGSGSMLAVGISADGIGALLKPFGGRIDIAAINGPATLTLAGDTSAIEQLAQQLNERGLFNRVLTVEVPYHSYLMDPILDDLGSALQPIVAHEPVLPVYSTVTGQRVSGPSYGADYWPRNVRQPVAFMAAVRALLDEGFTTFIEVGPHPVLSGALRDCAKAATKEINLIETLRRKEPERIRVQRAIAQVFANGCRIDWTALNGTGRFTALPNYPWQRQRAWLEAPRTEYERISPTDHPMLGYPYYPATNVWINDLEHEALAYLRDHKASDTPLMPATGYIETLLEAAAMLHPDAPGWRISDVEIHAPLVISSDRATDYVTAYDSATRGATIRSIASGEMGDGQLHFSGVIDRLTATTTQQVNLPGLFDGFGAETPIEDFYRDLSHLGLQYGPKFQAVRQLRIAADGDHVLARIERPADLPAAGYHSHPSMLDGCLQALIATLRNKDSTWLPTRMKELRLYTHVLPARYWCHAWRVSGSARHIDAEMQILDDDGVVLADMRGMRMIAVPGKLERLDEFGDAIKLQMVRYEWFDAGPRNEAKRVGPWLIVEEGDAAFGNRIAQRMELFGGFKIVRLHVSATVGLDQDGRIGVRANNAEDIAAALQAAGQLVGVVFAHGQSARLDGPDPTGLDALQLMREITRQFAQRSTEERPRAYVLTRGAFCLWDHDVPVEPAQTALNGFARVAYNEIEGMRFSTLDLPSALTTDEQFDEVILELTGDAPDDEIALRRGLRLCSRLTHDLAVTQPRTAALALTAQRHVRVHGLADNEDGPGLVKLIEVPCDPLGEDDIELRIEHGALTVRQLAAVVPKSDQGDYIEVIGTVSAVGAKVTDLHPGMRVYGLARGDLGSHIRGARHHFHVVEINRDVSATSLLLVGVKDAVASRLVQQAELAEGACALVQADTAGLAVAAALRRCGVAVTLAVQPGAAPPPGYEVIEATSDAIDAAAATRTHGKGFDLIAADLPRWAASFGWLALAHGGGLIDTASSAQPLTVPTASEFVLRADLSVVTGRRAPFAAALRQAVQRAARGELAPVDARPVSIMDLVNQKPAMADADAPLIIGLADAQTPLPVQIHEAVTFRSDATYLVTGGFGGFGQKTAQWLVEHGARHLVLAGRGGADTPERQAFVQELQARAVEVVCEKCDLADAGQVRSLFALLASRAQPLRGVFHSAGAIIDEPISDMSALSLETVMRAKAESARLLHEHTRDLELDFFVLYSSIANLVGSSRQANYVAANGFLDGLAWRRRALGLPATSINWGPIADVGMIARDEALRQFMRLTGMRGMQTSEALHWLERVLRRDMPQLGVLLIASWLEWSHFEAVGGQSPRFAALVEADSSVSGTNAHNLLHTELQILDPADRFTALANKVLTLIAGQLGMATENVLIDRPILDYGVDSLMAAEIQLLLGTNLGIPVPIIEILDGHLTVRKVVERTLADFGWGEPTANVAGHAEPSIPTAVSPTQNVEAVSLAESVAA